MSDVIDFARLERIDGVRPRLGFLDGHEGDCVVVYRQDGIAYKVVHYDRDPYHPRHMRELTKEYELLRLCDHPCILQPLGMVLTNDYAAMRMPYYGMPLARRYAHLEQNKREEIRGHVEDAVRHLYDHGIVHGDLVVKNFLWDSETQRPILFDFQTARLVRQTLDFQHSLDVMGESVHKGCCRPFPSVNLRHLFSYELPL